MEKEIEMFAMDEGYGLLFLPNKHSFVHLSNLKIVRQQRTTGDYYAS